LKPTLISSLGVEGKPVDLVESPSVRRRSVRSAAGHIAMTQPKIAATMGLTKNERVSGQKAARAEEVQALVDAAPVVQAVVVPALLVKLLREG